MMTKIYTTEAVPAEITKSIFLAGPTLRKDQQDKLISWRIKALQVLEALEYNGIVFIPEARSGSYDLDWDNVTSWETKCLNIADDILFYINRNLQENLLGLTTNDEWGYWKDSGKCVLCTAVNADKVEYQEKWAKDLNVPIYHELYNSLKYIMDKQGEGALRNDGYRWIPLYIWNNPGFQTWKSNLEAAGNRLEEARVKDVAMKPDGKPYSFRIWCNIFIPKEDRFKNNEFFITRPDISACLLYYPRPDPLESEIILVKEFRTPVNNIEGYVYELPGGSVPTGIADIETAIEELGEETGFTPKLNKMEFIGARQLAATMLTHQCHLWSYQLDAYELNELRMNATRTWGVADSTELTYIEIKKVREVIDQKLLDWSNVGMILNSIIEKFTL